MITQERLRKMKRVTETAVRDMDSDIKALDGKPLNIRALAELMGSHYAVTKTLAAIIVELVDEKTKEQPET